MDFRVYSNLFIYLLLDNTHFNRKVELNILCIKNGRLARASNQSVEGSLSYMYS